MNGKDRSLLTRAGAVLLVALLGAAVALPAGAASDLSLRKAKKKFYTKKLADQLFLTQQEADALYAGSGGQRLVWSAPADTGAFIPSTYTEFDSLTVPAGTWLLQATMNFSLNVSEPGTTVVGTPFCRLVGPQDVVLAEAPGRSQTGDSALASSAQALVTTAASMLVRLQCRDAAGASAGSFVSQIRIAATSFGPQDVTED